MASTSSQAVAAGATPELALRVLGAAAPEYAAVPTVSFRLGVEAPGGLPIRSVLLDVQIQIAARRRPYDDAAKERLGDLFGTPDRWRDTLRTLPWTRSTIVVPGFDGATEIDLPVTCTYDLEVSASTYMQALDDGEVPLEFLFSGTVFYADPDGRLQATRIPWTQEADFGMPVRVWREAIDRHFPDSAWLRVARRSFDRLQAYRSRHSLASWDEAIDSLLAGRDDPG